MHTYEICNPSDPYTMEADDLEVAAVAVFALGGGHYPLLDKDGATVVPAFLFGGSAEWVAETFSCTVDELFERVKGQKRAALVAALDSVQIPGGRERSSLNDIGGRAKKIVKALSTPPERAP